MRQLYLSALSIPGGIFGSPGLEYATAPARVANDARDDFIICLSLCVPGNVD